MDSVAGQVNIGTKTLLTSAKPLANGNQMTNRVVGVTLPVGSKPIKLQGDTPQEFLAQAQSSILTWLNFTVKDVEKDGTSIATTFGFNESLVPSLMKGYPANFEDRDAELGILLPAVRVKRADLDCFPLLILVRKNLILSIHSENTTRLINFSRYAETFVRKMPENMLPDDKATLMLYRIIDENNNRNFEQLREIEEQADWLSESLLDPKAERGQLGKSIYEMKHVLLTYLNTLWRNLDVLNNLRYGDADLISDNPKVLAKINLLVVDLNQQISLTEHMSQVLGSGLEVIQSIYNNQLMILNNRMVLAMTWLTILATAVLVPNTLATIGGMLALEGNELVWYILVIILSTVTSTILAWWWISKKITLPTKEDQWITREAPRSKRE